MLYRVMAPVAENLSGLVVGFAGIDHVGGQGGHQ